MEYIEHKIIGFSEYMTERICRFYYILFQLCIGEVPVTVTIVLNILYPCRQISGIIF